MQEEKRGGGTFVERLLGGERRPPYQRGRGAGKLDVQRGHYTKLLRMRCIKLMGENGSIMAIGDF